MRPSRTATLAAGALLVAGLVGLWAWGARDDPGPRAEDNPVPRVVVRARGPAEAPFEGFTDGTIRVGDRTLRVVVADEPGERSLGLRGRQDAAPYDAMLFVFDGTTTTAFTMAGVVGPLDIGFYAADGAPVDRLRMEPCAGSDATCPIYESSGAFRYALETAAGELPPGGLRTR